MNQQDQAQQLSAALDEAEALIVALRQRCTALNGEIRMRDSMIENQEKSLEALAAKVKELTDEAEGNPFED